MQPPSLSCEFLSGHADIVLALAVSPDGHWLVSASKDGTARLWDLRSLSCVAIAAGHAESIGAIAISPKMHGYARTTGRGNSGCLEGPFFITGSADKTMKRWHIPGDLLTEAPNTSSLSSSSLPRTLHAMAAVKAHDKDVNAVAIAPNDRILASASQDKLIKIWQASTMALLGTCRGHKRGIWAIAFSPVDQCLASASSDKTVKLWNISDFSCLKTFEGHTASVLNVSFVCAGMQLISSGADGLLKLWTIKTNVCEATFDRHTDKVWALAVARDGTRMLTGGADSRIHLWHDMTEREQEKEQAAHDAHVMKEQALLNCLYVKDYARAIEIAFEIQHPFRLMQILREVKEGPKDVDAQRWIKHVDKDVDDDDDAAMTATDCFVDIFLQGIIHDLDKLKQLLEWMRDWNTNAKQSEITQWLIASLLRHVPPAQWAKMHENSLRLLDGLIAYSERHFQRMERLLQKSFVVDFTILSMQKRLPDVEKCGSGGTNLDTLSNKRKADEMVQPTCHRVKKLNGTMASVGNSAIEMRMMKHA